MSFELLLELEFGFILGFILFWLIVFLLSRHPSFKRRIEFRPFFFMYRTKMLNRFFRDVAKKLERFWGFISNPCIVAGFAMMFYGLYLLTNNLIAFFFAPERAERVIVPLPGITIGPQSIPFFLLSFAIIALLHEGAHAIAMHREKLGVKSTGFFIIFLIFGAFTEEYKRRLERADLKPKLRIYSIGSSANLLGFAVALLLLVSFSAIATPFYLGTIIEEVKEDGPAYEAGLRAGDTIIVMKGAPTPTLAHVYNSLQDLKPGDEVEMKVWKKDEGAQKVLSLRAARHPKIEDRGYLGIVPSSLAMPKPEFWWLPKSFPFVAYTAIFWITWLSFFVAVFNMLPMYPLDGGYFIGSIVKHFWRETKAFRVIISSATLSLLLSNVVMTFIQFGFIRI